MIIPPQLMFFLGKYGARLGAGVLALLILGGAYYWHRSKIYDEGYQDAVNVYEKRGSEFRAKAEKQLAKIKIENEVKRNVDRENYLKAIKTYAEYSENIKREHDRAINGRVFVRVKTKRADTCDGSVPSKANVPERVTPGNEQLDWAELGLEDRANLADYKAEVKKMALLCKQAAYAIEQNFEVK